MLFNSRFSLAWKIYLIALVYFVATRIFLLVDSFEHNSFTVINIFHIFAIGFLYDSLFYLYALIPVSLYLLLMPQIIWQTKIHKIWLHLLVFVTLYGLGFIVVAELLFWNEFSVRFNFISVDYLVYRREVTDNISESYPLATLLSAIFIVSLIAYYWIYPYINHALNVKRQSWKQQIAIVFTIFFISILGMQFIGQNLRTQTQSTYVRELSSNGPYQFVAAFRNNKLNYREFYRLMDQKEQQVRLREQIKQNNAKFLQTLPSDSIKREISYAGAEKNNNIILVMIESLSAEYMGIFGNKKNLTPNLDKLSKESLLFTSLYATGTRTTRGLEAVTLSIPPTPGRSIVKRIGHESNMFSLGNILKSKAYNTKFLYGGRGYFDNMNAFFSGNGYGVIDQNSVSKEQIGFSNAWGMADEYLYQQVIKAADFSYNANQPFFFHVMTTSNHRPYTYPDNRIDIPSGTGRSGAVKYTDWAINNFIQQAKKRAWFDNTIFVFVADHTAGSAGKVDLPINRYHIPLMIYAPKLLAAGEFNKIISQIDIAPTLLGLMNMSYVSSFFGKDVLLNKDEGGTGRALIANYQHLAYYTQGKLSILSPKQVIHQYINPETNRSEIKTLDENHLKTTQAYYQGADFIYSHHLNNWQD